MGPDRLHTIAGSSSAIALVFLWQRLPFPSVWEYIGAAAGISALAAALATALVKPPTEDSILYAALGALTEFAVLATVTILLVVLGYWHTEDLLSLLIAPFSVAAYSAAGIVVGEINRLTWSARGESSQTEY